MKERAVISLNQKEQLELEQILSDGDENAALRFLKEVVQKKVLKATASGCKPVFEWQGREPELLKELKGKKK